MTTAKEFVTSSQKIPLLGFIAPSGTGKTQLLEKVIAQLTAKGLRVGLIKHSHHNFDIDVPGKDSYRLRKAGALQTMIASESRWALISEGNSLETPPTLSELLKHFEKNQLDLILIEGFKGENFAKIILHRPETGKPLLAEDEYMLAYATSAPLPIETNKTVLNIDNPNEITAFIRQFVKQFDPTK